MRRGGSEGRERARAIGRGRRSNGDKDRDGAIGGEEGRGVMNGGEKEVPLGAPRSTRVLSKARSVAGRPRLNRCRVDWGRA